MFTTCKHENFSRLDCRCHFSEMFSAMRIITSLSRVVRRQKTMFVCGSAQRRVFIYFSEVVMERTFPS